MTTYILTGIFVDFNEVTGLADSFTPGVTLQVAFPTGSSTFTYTVDFAGGPGETDEVTVNSSAYTALIDGQNEAGFNNGTGAIAEFGQVVWDDNGTTKTSYILNFLDDIAGTDYIFVVGGDAFPPFANAAAFNSFLQNDIISIGSAPSGSGFAEGDTIDLASAPNVFVTENDTIIGSPNDDVIDPGENTDGDYIGGSSGNDTITFANQTGNDDFNTLDYGGLNAPITATLNGVTDTGTVNKGANGTDTILGVTNVFDAGWFNGGLQLIGTDYWPAPVKVVQSLR